MLRLITLALLGLNILACGASPRRVPSDHYALGHNTEEVPDLTVNWCAVTGFGDVYTCTVLPMGGQISVSMIAMNRCDPDWQACRRARAIDEKVEGAIDTDQYALYVHWPFTRLATTPNQEIQTQEVFFCGYTDNSVTRGCVVALPGTDMPVEVKTACDPTWNGCRKAVRLSGEVESGTIDPNQVDLYMAWPLVPMPEHQHSHGGPIPE